MLNFSNTFNHGSPVNSDGTPNTGVIATIYQGSFIKLVKIVGSTTTELKTWFPSTYYGTVENFTNGITIAPTSEEYWLEYTPGTTYKLIIDFPTIPTSVYTYPNCYGAKTYTQCKYFNYGAINTTTSYTCGMRVKSIKNYTAPGALASYKQINYYDGKLLYNFEPLASIEAAYNNYISNNIYSSYKKRISISSDDFGINGPNPIGYGKVEEIELVNNGTNNRGKKVFFYSNVINTGYKGMPADPIQTNGQLYLEVMLNKQLDTVYKKQYTFSVVGTSQGYGLRIRTHIFGNTDQMGDVQAGDPMSMPAFGYKFSWVRYPITAEVVQQDNVKTTEYFNGSKISTLESYTYNPNGQQKTVTTTFDDADTANYQKVQKYYYPGEIAGGPASETQMATAQMTGIPVQTEEYRGTQLLSTQKTEYVVNNVGLLFPKYIYHKKGSETEANIPTELKVTFDKYDDYGNLVQYTLTDGTPVVYIWGYNYTMPIAKIENALYDSITASLVTNAQTASNGTNEANLITALNSLRTNLTNAMVTTYTYKPLIGVSTITDPKGYKISYTYDGLGRLQNVKDASGYLLSESSYNYNTTTP